MSVPLGLQPPRRVEFRRPARSVRRRRRSLWVVVFLSFCKAVVMVGLPLALVTWLFTSPRFALQSVEIATGPRVPATWADSALHPLVGRNLFLLSLDEADRRLAGHPWLAEAKFRKQLPSTLVVELEERQPAAVVWTEGGPVFVDDEGEAIAEAGEGEREGFLVIRSPENQPRSSRNALLAARALTRARPQWGLSLTEVEVLGREDFRLHTSVLPFPLVVRPETTLLGVEHLARILPGLERELGVPAEADLRFPYRIVLEPAEGAPSASAPSVDT